MIEDTLSQIQQRIQSGHLREEQKAELLRLVERLQAEISTLSTEDADQARSIAGYTGISAHEASRESRNPELLEHSLQGLANSVRGIEQSHPRLVEVVNNICVTLSNLGI